MPWAAWSTWRGWLALDGNELSGPIPDALGGLANLQSLSLAGNKLSGPIPSALRRLAKRTGAVVASWRDRPPGANPPPAAAGTLPDRELTLGRTLSVDVAAALVDPDGDALTYAVTSSAPAVVTDGSRPPA